MKNVLAMNTAPLVDLMPRRMVWMLVMAGLLVACQPKSEPAAAAAKPVVDAMQVQIAPEMASRFQVAQVQYKDLESTKEVAGRIEANDRLVTRIGASVTGRVTEVLVEVGDRVQPGQALARVASPELSQAQMAYLRAHSGSALADRAVERARQLYQADVIGSAELQRRESEQAVARAEKRATQDQLRLLGIPSDALERLRDQGTLHPYATVVSTLSGVVIERKVSNGQVAQPGDPLFTVADLSKVWVVGDLPEQTARMVQVGQRVDIEVPALGGASALGQDRACGGYRFTRDPHGAHPHPGGQPGAGPQAADAGDHAYPGRSGAHPGGSSRFGGP